MAAVNLIKSDNSKRNVTLRNNIILSGIFKFIGLISSLLIVPITLHYLDKEEYGIWLTISSILTWVSFFDIGLGNSLRNYLTQAVSKKDFTLGRTYLSTTLIMMFCIASTISILLFFPITFMNLNKVFNSYAISDSTLRNVMFIAIGVTLIYFIVKNIGYIYIAMQKIAVNEFLIAGSNVIALLIIYILTKYAYGNLSYVVLVYTITPVVLFLIASVPIFTKYPKLKPTFNAFDKKIAKQITSKGVGFFFIQITSCLVIYGSSNLFITQFCGPTGVTTYNIAFKYFNLMAIAYTIVISPMWNAYTDAYIKNDMKWIKKTFNKSLFFCALSVVGGIVMFIFCNIFYRMWVGNSVQIPLSVSLCVLAYISFFNFNNCTSYLLNGLNIIRVQIYTSIAFTILYLISVFIMGHRFGIEGVVLCMAVCYALMGSIHLYQCHLILKRKAIGIWGK